MSPARRNLIAYYVNFIVMALVGLLANPWILAFLGPASFGIWKASQRIFEVATSIDGGAPQALKWIMAHQSARSGHSEQRQAIAAAAIVWLLWLPVMALLTAIVTVILPYTINDLLPEQVPMTQMTGLVLSINIVLMGLLTIPTSVLIGLNRGYWALALSTAMIVTSNIAMIMAARLGYGVVGIAVITLVSSVVLGLVTWLVARKVVPWWGVERPPRANIRSMVAFSGWFLAWSYVQRILLSSELLLLSILVGAVAVAHYTFTSYVMQFALSLCLLTTSAFMPQLGKSLGENDRTTAHHLIKRSRELTLAAVTLCGCAIILLNRDFVALWVGPQYFLGYDANAALVVGMVQLAILRNDAQLLDAGLKVSDRTISGAIATVVGLTCATVAFLATGNVVAMLLGLVVGRLFANFRFSRLVTQLNGTLPVRTWPYAISVAMLATSYALGRELQVTTWLELVAAGTLVIPICAGAIYFGVLSSETRSDLTVWPRSLAR